MRTEILIAGRQLMTRSGMGLSFMTSVSIAGVSIGVGALIIVLSVMGGFEKSLIDNMLNGEPHLELFHPENVHVGISLKEYDVEVIKNDSPEIDSVTAFTKMDVVLKHRKHLQSAQLLGIASFDQDDLKSWLFASSMIEGSVELLRTKHRPIQFIDDTGPRGDERPGILLGDQLALNLGVDIGDELTIVNPNAAIDEQVAISGGTVERLFVVVGIFSTGVVNYDAKLAVVPLAEGRRFLLDYDSSLDEDEYVSGIGITLKDPMAVDQIAKKLSSTYGLQALSWQDSNASLLFALKLEKFTMGTILMLIVLVAAFSISGTMMMMVYHKRGEISVLRAIGMNQMGILKVYLLNGLLIALVGTVIGLGGGLFICLIIDQFIIYLPPDVYYNTKLPVRYLPQTYMVVCVSALFLSMFASVFPALSASMQDPSAGLRYQ
jgi:lipoprotein-releasing system permease protein